MRHVVKTWERLNAAGRNTVFVRALSEAQTLTVRLNAEERRER